MSCPRVPWSLRVTATTRLFACRDLGGRLSPFPLRDWGGRRWPRGPGTAEAEWPRAHRERSARPWAALLGLTGPWFCELARQMGPAGVGEKRPWPLREPAAVHGVPGPSLSSNRC